MQRLLSAFWFAMNADKLSEDVDSETPVSGNSLDDLSTGTSNQELNSDQDDTTPSTTRKSQRKRKTCQDAFIEVLGTPIQPRKSSGKSGAKKLTPEQRALNQLTRTNTRRNSGYSNCVIAIQEVKKPGQKPDSPIDPFLAGLMDGDGEEEDEDQVLDDMESVVSGHESETEMDCDGNEVAEDFQKQPIYEEIEIIVPSQEEPDAAIRWDRRVSITRFNKHRAPSEVTLNLEKELSRRCSKSELSGKEDQGPMIQLNRRWSLPSNRLHVKPILKIRSTHDIGNDSPTKMSNTDDENEKLMVAVSRIVYIPEPVEEQDESTLDNNGRPRRKRSRS